MNVIWLVTNMNQWNLQLALKRSLCAGVLQAWCWVSSLWPRETGKRNPPLMEAVEFSSSTLCLFSSPQEAEPSPQSFFSLTLQTLCTLDGLCAEATLLNACVWSVRSYELEGDSLALPEPEHSAVIHGCCTPLSLFPAHATEIMETGGNICPPDASYFALLEWSILAKMKSVMHQLFSGNISEVIRWKMETVSWRLAPQVSIGKSGSVWNCDRMTEYLNIVITLWLLYVWKHLTEVCGLVCVSLGII